MFAGRSGACQEPAPTVVGVRFSDHLAHRPRLVLVTLASLACVLLAVRFRDGTRDALEVPILANAAAIGAGLVLASLILVSVRRTVVRAHRRSHE
jgi:hypothetical protein